MPRSSRQIDPAEEARMRENALAFARCMRDHGVDMPDPTFEAGGMVRSELRGKADGDGPDPESPVFQDAQKACEDQVGMKGPGMRVHRSGPGDDTGADKGAGE
jgi:hypothetical protein